MRSRVSSSALGTANVFLSKSSDFGKVAGRTLGTCSFSFAGVLNMSASPATRKCWKSHEQIAHTCEQPHGPHTRRSGYARAVPGEPRRRGRCVNCKLILLKGSYLSSSLPFFLERKLNGRRRLQSPEVLRSGRGAEAGPRRLPSKRASETQGPHAAFNKS